jgi:hypothetical protein
MISINILSIFYDNLVINIIESLAKIDGGFNIDDLLTVYNIEFSLSIGLLRM